MDAKKMIAELADVIRRLGLLLDSLKTFQPLTPGFPEEKLELVEKHICLKCGEPILEIEVPTRGCHTKCYKRIRDRIKAGEYTDEQAVSFGLMLPPSPGGRKASEQDEQLSVMVREAARQWEGKAKRTKRR